MCSLFTLELSFYALDVFDSLNYALALDLMMLIAL